MKLTPNARIDFEEHAMTTINHEIYLESEERFDGRLPTHHLGFLLADLPVAVRGAVSMALCNRSKSLGKQPNWLKRASDENILGLKQHRTVEALAANSLPLE